MPSILKTLAITTALLLPAVAMAKQAKVDAGHSAVHFKAQHFGAGYTWGHFGEFGGSVDLNDAHEPQSFNITVQAASVDTGVGKRDSHLKGPDFLDVKQFETITFVSTKVEKKSDTLYVVTGDLTLHGQSKEYTVEMIRTGIGELPVMMGGGTAVGFETVFKVDQKDHGMHYDAVGDVLSLFVNLEVKA